MAKDRTVEKETIFEIAQRGKFTAVEVLAFMRTKGFELTYPQIYQIIRQMTFEPEFIARGFCWETQHGKLSRSTKRYPKKVFVTDRPLLPPNVQDEFGQPRIRG